MGLWIEGHRDGGGEGASDGGDGGAVEARLVQPRSETKGDEGEVGAEEPHPEVVRARARVAQQLARAVDDVDGADEAREDLVREGGLSPGCGPNV